MEWILLLKLVIAHVIGDFVMQPKRWVLQKQAQAFKAPSLYFHTLLHAALAYIIVGDWSDWKLPFLVFIMHTAIDIWKSLQKRSLNYFLIDQALHFISLIALSIIFSNTALGDYLNLLQSPQVLLLILAYILVLRPYAFVVDLFTEKWRKQIRVIEAEDEIGSLNDAGKYIGMLERFLVLTFILSGNPSAIGMLIAAKSILRFNDLKGEASKKMSEYVLIGTLLSFSLCIITGLIVNKLLKLF
jgi:hypothetical protein